MLNFINCQLFFLLLYLNLDKMKKIVFKMFEKMFVDFGNEVLQTRKEKRLIHEVLTYEITDADLQNFKNKL